MRHGSALVVLSAATLIVLPAAAAGWEVVNWTAEITRLAISMAIVFGSAAIGYSLARIRGRRHVALMEAAIEGVPQPRQIVDRKGRVVAANAACRSVLGRDGVALVTVLAPQLAAEAQAALADLAARAGAGTAGEIEVEAALGSEGGRPTALLVGASPVAGRRGTVLWRIEDVSRRRAADEALSAERKRQVELITDAPVGFYMLDAEGRILRANATFAGWIGRTPASLVDSAAKLAEMLVFAPQSELLDPTRHNDGGQAEVQLRRADGALIDLLAIQERVATADAVTFRGIAFDLTAQRELERRLKLTGQRFQHFFEKAPIGVALLDQAGHITECNHAFAEIVGQDGGRLVGRCVLDLIKPEAREAVAKGMREPGEAGQPRIPIEVKIDGREETVASLYLARLADERGTSAGLICHIIDLTEQRRLEAQFAQSQKMQAVGQLAGGIAHDFNNLLTAMIGFCDLLLLRHRPGDQSFADIMQIKQNANRAANLVRQLLAFSRQQTLQPRVLNVADALTELSHLLRRLIGENIELKMIHGRELGLVKVDQGQLEQVIINLAVNARDAMATGGTLTIRTGNFTASVPIRRGAEVMPPGDYVRIEVSDTGTGIDPEIVDRIFEPFFSTKEVGAGTGLGLSTVYGIVRQTGGFIFVDSRPSEGAQFTIYLPVHAAERAGEARADAAEATAAGRDLTGIGTILLVEDEDAVRLFGARALRNKGYEVLEARSGDGALELIASQERPVDLLISDVVMPRMDGPTLVRTVRERWPHMKVIFISGYAEDAFRKRLDETGDTHFLPKPFTLKQLATRVKEVMESPGRAEPKERATIRRGGIPTLTLRN